MTLGGESAYLIDEGPFLRVRISGFGSTREIGAQSERILAECLATGLLGGLLGVALGIVAAEAVGAFGPTLSASTTSGGLAAFGLGNTLARHASTSFSLDAPVTWTLLLLGFALAMTGGLIAGSAGALRAARLRPADALRQVE